MDFYTKRFTFGGGRAVMESVTSFLGSRLSLQCIFYDTFVPNLF